MLIFLTRGRHKIYVKNQISLVLYKNNINRHKNLLN